MSPDDRVLPMSDCADPHAGALLRAGPLGAPGQPGRLGRLGRFELIRLLGEGGMGWVYLAREPVTHTLVAVKVMRPEVARDRAGRHRFLAEARHMYRMAHPHVLKVLEVADDPEGAFFVMPYMEGGSLAERIAPGRPLPSETIVEIGLAVAQALEYAHDQGLIHRDLKPANVLLDRQGRVWLADFGLARTVFNDSILEVGRSAVEGTAPYLSPAMAQGKAEDTRCDIYAFGCLLYEMLTGSRPYEAPTVEALLRKIAEAPPRPIRALNPKAPEGLVRIAEGAMARVPRDRYACMADVVCDLERVGRGRAPFGPRGRMRSSLTRGRAGTLLGIVAMAGLAVGLWLAVGARRPAERVSPPGEAVASATDPAQRAFVEAERLRGSDPAAAASLYADAARQYRQATQRNPRDPVAWTGLGLAQLGLGHREAAREALIRAGQLDAHHPLVLYGQGRFHWAIGERDRALALWERALGGRPEASGLSQGVWATYLAESCRELTEAYQSLGRNADALRVAERWVELDPHAARARRRLAEARDAQGR